MDKFDNIFQNIWIIFTLIFFINGLPFIYLGSKLNKKTWIYAGLFFEIPTIISIIFTLQQSALSSFMIVVGGMGMLFSVPLSFLYALSIRKECQFLELKNKCECEMDKFNNHDFDIDNYLNNNLNQSHNLNEINHVVYSLWIIPTIFFFINGLPFIYIGLRVSKIKWIILGVFFEIPVITSLVATMMGFSSKSIEFSVSTLLMILFMIISFIYALVIRKEYYEEIINRKQQQFEFNEKITLLNKLLDGNLKTTERENTNDSRFDKKRIVLDSRQNNDFSEDTIENININTASFEKLEKLPGINIILIKKLENIRNQGIKINNMEELAQLWNLTPTQINKLSPYISFNSSDDFSRSRHVDL